MQVSPSPKAKSPPKMNAGQYAKMTKKLQEHVALVATLKLSAKERDDEICQLKEIAQTQDQQRRTKEVEHSDEMKQVLGEMQIIRKMMEPKP